MRKGIMSLLCVIMMISLLAACGSSTKDSNGGSKNTQDGTQVASPTKFTMAKGTLAVKAVESVENWKQDKWLIELQKRTNTDINIQLIPHKDFAQKVTLMFTGSQVPDVLVGNTTPTSNAMRGAVEAGVFLPLDDILKTHGQNLLKVIPQGAWDDVTYNGKIYSIPQYLTIQSRRATFIRQDLLDEVKMEAPKTIDDLLPVLRAFKELGVEQPFGFRENFKYSDFILGAYDVLPYSTMYEKQGDEIVPKFFNSENMMKALEVYKAMYDEGLMAKDFATITGAMWTKGRDSGKVGIFNANSNQLGTYENELNAAVPNGKLALIPSPTGPDGKGGLMLYSRTLEQAYLNAKMDQAKAEEIVKFFDYMVTEEGERFFNFGIEGEDYTITADGKIEYNVPETDEERASEQRRDWLRLIKDGGYNKDKIIYEVNGQEMLTAFENILPYEGRAGISFNPDLDSYTKYTDLAPNFDEPSKFILDHMVKMIYGKEPISDWPKVIEEWRASGGDEIIKEATKRYNDNDGITIGPDSKVH